MKNVFLLLAFIAPLFSYSQEVFTGTPVDGSKYPALKKTFRKVELYKINVAAINNYVSTSQSLQIGLMLGSASYSLDLSRHTIVSPGYKLLINGRLSRSTASSSTYTGTFEGGKTRLTITSDVIYGLFRQTGKEMYIEPLWYHDINAPRDIVLWYDSKDVITDGTTGCGVTETEARRNEILQGRDPLGCYITDIAIASDHSMVIKYGTAAAVEIHNIGVMNNVQTDYDDGQLGSIVNFNIVTQNISTTESNDQTSPLYTGTNSSTILSGFRAWGNAGNFGVTYDVAQLWTNRNIDDDGAGGSSSIVGLAYVGVVCGTSRYHLLEDYTGTNPSGNGYQLRVLTSHELGHNFAASHDAAGSGFIMAPSINNTTTWSPASIASISNHLATRTCLATCIPPGDCGVVKMLTYNNITSSSATISWAALEGSTSYDVEYKPAGSTTWISLAGGTTATSFSVGSLTQGTLYDWRVRPYCANGQGEFTQSQFATSSVVISCQQCDQPRAKP